MLTGQGIALWILGTIFILNLVFVVLIIFFDRKKPVNTLAWILTFTFLPVVGFILYLFFGNRLHLRRVDPTQKSTVNKILEQILIAQKQQIDNDEISFHDSEMEKHVDMIYMNLEYDDAIFTQDNEIEIYTHGQEKYISIFQDIENAQSSINLLYFIFTLKTMFFYNSHNYFYLFYFYHSLFLYFTQHFVNFPFIVIFLAF